MTISCESCQACSGISIGRSTQLMSSTKTSWMSTTGLRRATWSYQRQTKQPTLPCGTSLQAYWGEWKRQIHHRLSFDTWARLWCLWAQPTRCLSQGSRRKHQLTSSYLHLCLSFYAPSSQVQLQHTSTCSTLETTRKAQTSKSSTESSSIHATPTC